MFEPEGERPRSVIIGFGGQFARSHDGYELRYHSCNGTRMDQPEMPDQPTKCQPFQYNCQKEQTFDSEGQTATLSATGLLIPKCLLHFA